MMELLVAGGAGALFGGAVTRTVDFVLTRSQRRHDAASQLADIASTVTELNQTLLNEVAVLKKAILVLTDTVDEILPHIKGLTAEQRTRLRDANNAAKLAV